VDRNRRGQAESHQEAHSQEARRGERRRVGHTPEERRAEDRRADHSQVAHRGEDRPVGRIPEERRAEDRRERRAEDRRVGRSRVAGHREDHSRAAGCQVGRSQAEDHPVASREEVPNRQAVRQAEDHPRADRSRRAGLREEDRNRHLQGALRVAVPSRRADHRHRVDTHRRPTRARSLPAWGSISSEVGPAKLGRPLFTIQ
jgi:hypothetical protein